MSGLLILAVSFVVLLGGYFIYGRWLANKWGIDENAVTPAYALQDGVDYVPAKREVVFGHQFASIAGAGPINGPIIAAMFGWVPVLLWILLGGIFLGAVQDFAAMYASVRNKGKTIGYLIELYIGKTGKRLFLAFTWLFSILVIAAFADIVAVTFAGLAADGTLVEANAAVASTSIFFIIAAVILGYYLQKAKPSGIKSSVIAILLLVACIGLGLYFPIYAGKGLWLYVVFAYIFVASITPVWILLQPRDYLNSFLLVVMIITAFIGVIYANPTMNIASFTGFEVNGNYLFPILFVTVACGAVSGFHSLISSGTSSKQIANERDMLPISFGGMMLECLLAVIALIAVGALASGGTLPKGSPPVIFATAISGFISGLGLPEEAVFTIITLAISAFALTSLDSVARIGRLSFQEFFTDTDSSEKTGALRRFFANRYIATLMTLLMGYLLALRGYKDIWPLFGSANQLLAALSLIACAVFLKKTKRNGVMLYVPMLSMLLITFSALGLTIYGMLVKIGTSSFNVASDGIQMVFAVLLLALGVMVTVASAKHLRSN